MQARQTIIFSGDSSWAREQAKQQSDLLHTVDALWISECKPADLEYTHLPHTKIRNILGREFNLIIFDALDHFHPDAFGAVTGTLRSGGVLILLLPDLVTVKSRFMRRLARIIYSSNLANIITKENNHKHTTLWNSIGTSPHIIQTTKDQLLAIKAIKKVITGHRRRPLVLTADRGRGKSAALGISAKELLVQKLQTILLTAPSKKSTDIVFKHATNTEGLQFIAPDELVHTLPKTDLLMIDEAAAIPAPLLSKLLKHYSRIVFSTTQHGYEGTGRGFDIRFKQELNKHTPNWQSLKLKAPIRWMANDPLEQFTFKALLLNADVDSYTESEQSDLITTYEINKIDRDELLKNEALLSQLFGLLVTAHYQTKPSDLQYLLDDKNISLYTITHDSKVLATAFTTSEGGFDSDFSQEVYAGKRRLKGHLIPQSLAFHSGIKEAAQLRGERIVRIAVHSNFQCQGLATQLIKYIKKHSQEIDYIGVSFAASTDMLTFWNKQEFKAVRLGLSRDASSGTHSVIELLPLSIKGKEIFTQLRSQFQYGLPHLLSESLRNIETEVVEHLFKKERAVNIQLEKWQWGELDSFSTTNRGYETCLASIWDWFTQFVLSDSFHHMESQKKGMLIAKILQRKTWQELSRDFRLTGKKEAKRSFKITIKQALSGE